MRGLLLLLLLAPAMAGCTADAPVPTPAPTDAMNVAPDDVTVPAALEAPRVILEGTYQWHLESGGAALLIDAIEMAAQPVLADCIQSDGDPWIANRPLGRPAPVPVGSAALEIAVDWDVEDFAGDALVLAYRHNDSVDWTESPYIGNGEPTTIELGADQWDTGRMSTWDLVLCTTRDPDNYVDTAGYRPTLVTGSIDVRVTAVPS